MPLAGSSAMNAAARKRIAETQKKRGYCGGRSRLSPKRPGRGWAAVRKQYKQAKKAARSTAKRAARKAFGLLCKRKTGMGCRYPCSEALFC